MNASILVKGLPILLVAATLQVAFKIMHSSTTIGILLAIFSLLITATSLIFITVLLLMGRKNVVSTP